MTYRSTPIAVRFHAVLAAAVVTVAMLSAISHLAATDHSAAMLARVQAAHTA
jgi:hypothetical protein